MITATKRFADIPFAHRQHLHEGHCRFIHGHNWAFTFTFGARELDGCGFVIDFGGAAMKALKQWINDTFDHKLVLNTADPMRPFLENTLANTFLDPSHPDKPAILAEVVVVPDGSCEGLARWVFQEAHRILEAYTGDRDVWIESVTVEEDSKNSATFKP